MRPSGIVHSCAGAPTRFLTPGGDRAHLHRSGHPQDALFGAQPGAYGSDAPAADRTLLGEAFALIDGHLLDQRMGYREQRYESSVARLYLDSGVGLSGEVDPLVTQVLLRLDGGRPLRQIVREAAGDTSLDLESLTEVTLATIRRLYGLGMLGRQTSQDGTSP